ncbi:MAG: 4-(cytidine 5'-diphospho)-2-C-methyl-D-erythritol kinase [Proteobacteria bacterium]|nr:4-(cytidine 5'-diphospho)-2-C-methyl-D-erythritol kinase [Pseudomonadota bacterium]
MATRREFAPAKVNFGLRIVGRRPSGYHELESVFAPLDWGDDVEVEWRPGAASSFRFELTGPGATPDVPSDERNLAARAARDYLDRAGETGAVSIRLHKRLPAAAGLGGGSSDAAAVLRALDRLAPKSLPPGGLAELAVALGADVPFFLGSGPAWVRGIGERVEPLAGLPDVWLVLAHPGSRLETARVFAGYAQAGRRPGPALGAPPELPPASNATAGVWREALRNDLEPAARELCPAIETLQARLQALGALATGLSGSGPTVYGLFASRPAAEAAAEAGVGLGPAWTRVAQALGSG